jgi:hypothetical protein
MRQYGSIRCAGTSNTHTKIYPHIRFVFQVTREVHNEELNDLYSLPNIVWVVKSKRMRCAGHVARVEKETGVHRVLVGKPERKRPLGRSRRRWEDNTKMNLQEVGEGRGV